MIAQICWEDSVKEIFFIWFLEKETFQVVFSVKFNTAYSKYVQCIFIEQIWSKNLKVSVLAEIWHLD